MSADIPETNPADSRKFEQALIAERPMLVKFASASERSAGRRCAQDAIIAAIAKCGVI